MIISLGIGALIFAIWLIILFFGKSIGLSMLLFVIPFSLFFIYILEKNNRIKNPKAKILLIPILLLSSTYFIFDNSFFNSLNLIIIPTLVSFMVLRLIGEKFEIKIDTAGKILSSFFRPISFIGEGTINFIDGIKEKLKINVKSKSENKMGKVIKAMLITIPIVLVIIILLSTADEMFANIFKGLYYQIHNLLNKINISISFIKFICIVIAFFYFIGLFYYICSKYKVIEDEVNKQVKKKENFAIKMILASLNIIYLVFCFIQIKSLFMMDTMQNYAYYARQGFFQLMIVSLINLVTILIAKRRENKEENKTNIFINYMSILMIAFTFIIVISAGVRMYFYESTYGYTLLRLLVYCTLLTESILFIPTVLYILDKKVNFPISYFTIIIVIYVCMNFANFDNIIAKRNVDRYFKIGKIDLYYLEYATGSDAINQILRILETSQDTDDIKSETRRYINEKYKILNEEEMDYRNLNLSKIFAKSSIKSNMQASSQETSKEDISINESELMKENISINISEITKEEIDLSMHKGDNFLKLGDIAIYANIFDECIYTINLNNKNIKKIYKSENGIEKMYFDGKYIYILPHYYRGKGITRIDLDGNRRIIYEGSSIQMWIQNDKIYFIEQLGYDQINGTPQGNLCCMDKDGYNKIVLIENVKNYFYINNEKIYYIDQSTRSIYCSNLDGTKRKEIAKGRNYITYVNDNFLTYIDYSDGEKHHVIYLDNEENQEIGRFGNVFCTQNKGYAYTRKTLGNNENVENAYTLYNINVEAHTLENIWKNDTPLETLLYVYNNYAYFRGGSEFYRINLKENKNKEKLNIGNPYFINGKAYSVRTDEENAINLEIFNLDDMTEEIIR